MKVKRKLTQLERIAAKSAQQQLAQQLQSLLQNRNTSACFSRAIHLSLTGLLTDRRK
jgi:hypothetical protein